MAKDKSKKKENPFDAKGDDEKTTTVKKKKGAIVDPSSGDQFRFDEHVGQLVIVEPIETDSILTSASDEKADVIRANVTVLTEEDGKSVLDDADEYEDTILFGRVIYSSLRKYVGSGNLVVGVVGQGEKQKGKNAPWVIEPATEKQKAIAEKFLS